MSEYLPIVVAAPSDARTRLLQKNILPPHLFRNLATESLWEEHPGPAIYLWPYDIPYADSDKFKDEVTERVGDLPAFFGMDPRDAKDHQERMLSRVLFGSIVVHILFLDNRKTDTTPGYEERNETYAQFCTFEEIVKWSRNLKKVMEVRLLNNESSSTHILVIVSANQQVVTTAEEIKALNECIGESSDDEIKPFRACYFMDLNLNPGDSKKIIHSKYVWDVQVCRLLLTLLLSQEKVERESDEGSKFGEPDPLHTRAGVKIWRAEDCVFSIDQEYTRKTLKETLEAAAKTLQSQSADSQQQPEWIKLEEDVRLENKELLSGLEPNWGNGNKEIISGWRADAAAGSPSIPNCFRMMFYNWADIPAETLKQDLLSPEHWKKGFEERRSKRLKWSLENPPKDYTQSVSQFFAKLKTTPKILNDFIIRMYNIMLKRFEQQKSEKEQFWPEIAKLEKQRMAALKTADNDSKEFEKAQRYYVGRGLGLLMMVAVTAFCGWIIWRVFGLFGVGILKILLLSGMVFAGSVAAYILVMILHNFTGNRAANQLLKEYDSADQLMIKRDGKVKEMFFQGVLTRDVLTLQQVRFRTQLLAKRILSILETELQPELSQLAEENGPSEKVVSRVDPIEDRDGVRDAFLKMTRLQKGPFRPEKGSTKGTFDPDEIIDSYFSETSQSDDAFFAIWDKISSNDAKNAGYYPAKVSVSQLRTFVRRFFGHITEKIQESIDINKAAGDDVKNYLTAEKDNEWSKNFLSASLADYPTEAQTSYLFFSSSFEDPGDNYISGSDLKRFRSDELSKTTILALFFQEYSMRFALKEIPGKEYGQLTFEEAK